jgi:hypothetical protein
MGTCVLLAFLIIFTEFNDGLEEKQKRKRSIHSLWNWLFTIHEYIESCGFTILSFALVLLPGQFVALVTGEQVSECTMRTCLSEQKGVGPYYYRNESERMPQNKGCFGTNISHNMDWNSLTFRAIYAQKIGEPITRRNSVRLYQLSWMRYPRLSSVCPKECRERENWSTHWQSG